MSKALLPAINLTKHTRIYLEFKLSDAWIGVYWAKSKLATYPNLQGIRVDAMSLDIWICLIPMLPIHITHTWEDAEGPRRRKQALAEMTQLSEEMGLYDD